MHVNMHCRVTVHLKALPRNHHVDAAATKPSPFPRNPFDGIPQFGIVASPQQIPHCRPINLQHITRPPPLGRLLCNRLPGSGLAHIVHFAQVNHRIPLPNGRHHFFELMSRSMALSNICSARSFFSLPFSSSNARSRFASDGSMPPYLDLYL
jgi:hypothetical protein